MPTFLDEYKQLGQSDGLLGFLKNLGNSLSMAGGGEALQKGKANEAQQTLMQTLATLPQAEALQGPERNAALQFLKAGKVDDFQQTLAAAARSKKNQDQELLKQNLGNALKSKNFSQLDPSDQKIVQAYLQSGDPQSATSYFNAALSRVKSEDQQRTSSAIQGLNERAQNLKDNKAVVGAQKIVEQIISGGATAEDLAGVDPSDKETFQHLGINQMQAAQVQSAVAKMQKEAKAKIGGPGFFDRLGMLTGLGAPVGTLSPEQVFESLPTSLVTPSDLEQQQSVQAQRQQINQQQEALRTKQAGKSYFSPSPKVPKLSPEDMQALEWAKKNPKDPRAAQIRQRLNR